MKFTEGFTATELMVTLFVGVLLVISGYQLYSLVNLRAASSRNMAEASNIGYEVLRSEGRPSSPVTVACSSPESSHPAQEVNRTSSRLGLTITIRRCVPFTGSSLVRATVTVVYNYGEVLPAGRVVHATYVSAS